MFTGKDIVTEGFLDGYITIGYITISSYIGSIGLVFLLCGKEPPIGFF